MKIENKKNYLELLNYIITTKEDKLISINSMVERFDIPNNEIRWVLSKLGSLNLITSVPNKGYFVQKSAQKYFIDNPIFSFKSDTFSNILELVSETDENVKMNITTQYIAIYKNLVDLENYNKINIINLLLILLFTSKKHIIYPERKITFVKEGCYKISVRLVFARSEDIFGELTHLWYGNEFIV